MRCDEEKAFYPSKKQDVERVTDSDRGAEDVGLAIRTVLSTWEGQALAGELDVAPPGSCTRTGLPRRAREGSLLRRDVGRQRRRGSSSPSMSATSAGA